MSDVEKEPLIALMQAKSGSARDVAFLRMYADKIENGTARLWEIESIVRVTLSDIVDRVMSRRST